MADGSATARVWGNGMFIVNIAGSSVTVCVVMRLVQRKFLSKARRAPASQLRFELGFSPRMGVQSSSR